jgi:type II secretory pathway component GspD/PulD (secretin)
VIGGLLEDKVTNSDAGVPGVSSVPYFGNFFKSVDKINSKKELIILMRATVVDSNGFVDKADKDIYQKFMQDPRPIQFPDSSTQ